MLTEKGYQRPTYAELLEVQIERAKLLFGEDIDTSETSVLGKILRLQVLDLAEAYEDLENIYYARFPNSAQGISLDRLLPFAGITRNLATYAQHRIRLLGNPGADVDAGLVLLADNGLTYQTIDDCRFGETGIIETVIECNTTGSTGNYIKTLKLESPSEDITAAEWLAIETVGRDRESDVAARRRFQISKAGAGFTTTDSVKGAIMRVANVQAAEVIENKTDETVNGVPPHGFKCYVLCPDYVDYQVAEAIFAKKPLGVPCVGDLVFRIPDSGGLLHEVRFSKTEPVSIFMSISIKVNQYFEDSGVEDIKNNLVDYVAALGNGKTLVFTTLYGQIHKIPGVEEVTDLQVGKAGEEAAAQNITCEIYQMVSLEKRNIEVTYD